MGAAFLTHQKGFNLIVLRVASHDKSAACIPCCLRQQPIACRARSSGKPTCRFSFIPDENAVFYPILLAKQADILGFGLRFGTQLMIHRHGNQPGRVLEHGHIIPEKKKQTERIAAT